MRPRHFYLGKPRWTGDNGILTGMASMRPRHFYLGKHCRPMSSRHNATGFNEAEAFLPRKTGQPVALETRTEHCFNEAEAFLPRKTFACCYAFQAFYVLQ